jgi:hypothetical protein
VRLNLSSWARPELDPWFLDEALQLNFHKRELEALKALYKEELAHFGCVSVEQFIDVLRECGKYSSARVSPETGVLILCPSFCVSQVSVRARAGSRSSSAATAGAGSA